MDTGVITDRDCPISNRWIFKNSKILVSSPLFLIAILLRALEIQPQSGGQPISGTDIIAFFVFFLLVIGIDVVINSIKRRFFHFEVGSENLVIWSGVIARQERHMPYSRLQNVFVKQDLLDRAFGLKQVVVENAAGASGPLPGGNILGLDLSKAEAFLQKGGRGTKDTLGSVGNSLTIPGLRSGDAEALKTLILSKMTKHSRDDISSGL